MINLYNSDICYYCGEIDYKVSRCDVYAEDLRNNLYYRNKSNKFYLRSSSFSVMKVRMQSNIT